MAFKMKGPGLPGFRKAKPNAFYKSKPFQGDGRPSSSPLQHDVKDHFANPHEDGDSAHAVQTRRNAELSKSDYSTNENVTNANEDLDGDGKISQYEQQKINERAIDVKVRDEFTIVQQQNLIRGAKRKHENGWRNHLKNFQDEEGNHMPGISLSKEGYPHIKNESDQNKFNTYFNSSWQDEQEANSLGWAYPNVFGQVTSYNDRTPDITEQNIQLTNSEAIDYAIGESISAAPKDSSGNVKQLHLWSKREQKKYQDHVDKYREKVKSTIKDEQKDDIRTNIADRLTPEFITKHGTREQITDDVVKENNLVNVGSPANPKWLYANPNGDPDMARGEYVPENAWSSSVGFGNIMAAELGLDKEDANFWKAGSVKGKDEGNITKEVVEGTKEGVVGGGDVIVTSVGAGNSYSGTKTEGTTGISFTPIGGNRYNYVDAKGNTHQGLTHGELLEIKGGPSAELDDDISNQENDILNQKLKREKLSNEYVNTEPNVDDYKNEKQWKSAYDGWVVKGDEQGVDWDIINDKLYPGDS